MLFFFSLYFFLHKSKKHDNKEPRMKENSEITAVALIIIANK